MQQQSRVRKTTIRAIVAIVVTLAGFLPLPFNFMAAQSAHAGCFTRPFTPAQVGNGLSYSAESVCNPAATHTINLYLNKWNGGNMIWVASGSGTFPNSAGTLVAKNYSCGGQSVPRDWVTHSSVTGGSNSTSFAASRNCTP